MLNDLNILGYGKEGFTQMYELGDNALFIGYSFKGELLLAMLEDEEL